MRLRQEEGSLSALRRGLGSLRAAFWNWRTRWFTRFALGRVSRHVETVRGSATLQPAPDDLVVVCLMRDAACRVDSFVDHYSRLGAGRIILLDNGSTDDSVERALGREGVGVFRCTLPFRRYRTAMRRHLVERFGGSGWTLLVDIDEHWDYPCSDKLSLKSFLGYLDTHSFTAVAAHMIDLFPSGPVSNWPPPGPELQAAAVWFDLSDMRLGRLPSAATRNDFADQDLGCFTGGIRAKAFAAEPCLTKFPLTRRGGDSAPLVESAHFVSGARVADVTSVLFHYKFDSQFRRRTEDAVQRRNYYGGSSEYRQYRAALRERPDLELRGPDAVRLVSTQQLVDSGVLRAPQRLLEWRDEALRAALFEGQ